MNESRVREIAEEVLLPMLPGASIDGQTIASTTNERTVAPGGDGSILFKLLKSDPARFKLRRKQAFETSWNQKLSEIQLVRAFIDTIVPMGSELTGEFYRDLLPAVEKRMVARLLGQEQDDRSSILLSAIDKLDSWSRVTYEGARVSSALGFEWDKTDGKEQFSDFSEEDFSKVISNGFDTLLAFDNQGKLLSHECLSASTSAPVRYAPNRAAAYSNWANNQRTLLSLNRAGEILAFADGKIICACRFGRWFYLSHEKAISQMTHVKDSDLRGQLYETALDVSFARTGGCIGVIFDSYKAKLHELLSSNDLMGSSTKLKVKALGTVIGTKKFGDLDRRLRQELASIDGATVLGSDGTILAVGAILTVKDGSPGGGRTAAAMALARKGMAFKVSQDGGITGYRRSGENASEEAFRIMRRGP